MDIVLGIIAYVVIGFLLYGSWLMHMDEQALWQDRKDYERMKRDIEVNKDSEIL